MAHLKQDLSDLLITPEFEQCLPDVLTCPHCGDVRPVREIEKFPMLNFAVTFTCIKCDRKFLYDHGTITAKD